MTTLTSTETAKPTISLAVRDPARAQARRKAQAKKRWIKRIVGACVVLAAVAALVFAARPAPVVAEIAKTRRGPMQVTIDEAGRTRVRDRYVVLAPLAGDLTRITLRPGDPIARGQTLAQIVPQAPSLLDSRSRAEATARLRTSQSALLQAQANVTHAQLSLEHAQGDAERMRKLAANGTVNPDDAAHTQFEVNLRTQELASARFGADTAAHEVEMATAVLARYGNPSQQRDAFEIASPIEGRVLRVVQSSAGAIAPSTPLIELGDPREMEVVVDVLTEDAVRIPPRAKVVLDRWGGPWTLDAHARIVEPSAFTRLSALGVEEQRVSVVIDFDDPLERRAELGDGYRVEARIVSWENADVIAIPSSAAFRRVDGWAVFVVDQGRARLQKVEIGERSMTEVQILSGVAEGQEVILHPSDKVEDGARIATR